MGTRAPWFFDPWLIPRATVLGIVLVVPLVFDPSRDEVFAPIKATVLQAGLGFGLVMAAIALLRHRPSVRSVPVADMAVAGFVAWYLVGYVFSIDRSVGLHGEFPEYQGLSTTVAYTGLYLVARLCFTEPAHLQRLFVVLSVVTAAVGGYALLQRLGLDPLWGVATRPFSTVGQANSMAATLLVGLPAAVATAVARKGIPRILAWTAVVLGFFGLLTSLSRGGWLGMMAAAVVVLLFQKPRRRRSILLAALTTSAVLALLLAPSSPGRSLGQDARERLAASTSGEGSVSKHLTLWKLGARFVPSLLAQLGDYSTHINSVDGRRRADLPATPSAPTPPGVAAADFSRAILQRAAPWISVLPMDDVYWSDWGRPERLGETIQQLGVPSSVPAELLESPGGLTPVGPPSPV